MKPDLYSLQCTGCEACAEVCPVHAISMIQNNHGFYYPNINDKLCLQCGKCLKVCPLNNAFPEQKRLDVYAARAADKELLKKSSSGAIFTLLAEQILNQNGAVCGAAFNDEWQVVHKIIRTKEELAQLQGSKYVQSRIDGCYKEIRNLINAGIPVLFCGTPCQALGLKCMLGKDYQNLITVDLICHGVPSPLIWERYLKEMKEEKQIISVSFRDKESGWTKYALTFNFVDGGKKSLIFMKDSYMQGFLEHLYLRKSCHNCIAKQRTSYSDITLGDFWNIYEISRIWMKEDVGASAVILNTDKGKHLFEKIDCERIKTDFQTVLRGNPALKTSAWHNKKENFFWDGIADTKKLHEYIAKLTQKTFIQKIVIFVYEKMMGLKNKLRRRIYR